MKGYTLSKRLSRLIKREKSDEGWEFLGILYWIDERFYLFNPIQDEDGSLRFKDPPPEFWELLERMLYVGG